MKFFQETTDYKDTISNGVYLLSDDKTRMYAYVRPGGGVAHEFKNPIRIDTRGRTFKTVANTFGYIIPNEVAPEVPQWVITGSKGDEYIVRKEGKMFTCTCSGFKFRGSCKHSSEIRAEYA